MWRWIISLIPIVEIHNSPVIVLPGGFTMDFKPETHNNPTDPLLGKIIWRHGDLVMHERSGGIPAQTGTGGRMRDIPTPGMHVKK